MRASPLIELTRHKQGVVLPVKALAGAGRNEIRGVHNGSLKVAVTQVAEKGKANRAIISLLSRLLEIPKSDIELTSGTTSNNKQFLLHAVDVARLKQQLTLLLENGN
ncbi:MAG: DUF167 domain-containing protein [Pirellulaceae bacterium]